MKNQEIIETIKQHYTRELRKQLIKSILSDEKKAKGIASEDRYKVINQIFSYVIGALGWSIAQSTQAWDNSPLEIMREVFPKLEQTQWYQEQQLTVTKSIDVALGEKA